MIAVCSFELQELCRVYRLINNNSKFSNDRTMVASNYRNITVFNTLTTMVRSITTIIQYPITPRWISISLLCVSSSILFKFISREKGNLVLFIICKK